jgi:hypothetical protein
LSEIETRWNGYGKGMSRQLLAARIFYPNIQAAAQCEEELRIFLESLSYFGE